MTDKQLDELLRRALCPTEQPPELPKAAPRFPKRKAWMGIAAACLCFVVSAGVFLSMDFGAKSNDAAAPESAFDMIYATADSAAAVDAMGAESKTDSFDTVTEESVNSSVSGGATEPGAPSAVPSAPEEDFHESYGNLNLATLLDLSARYGENLTWDTFAPYFCEETAGDIYTQKFPVSSELFLLVGGDLDAEPEFIRLVLKAAPDTFVEMRTGNIKEFLKQNCLEY